VELLDGFALIPVMIGLFGLSEVLRNVRHPKTIRALSQIREVAPRWGAILKTWWQHKGVALRSSGLGTVIGALPGAGADLAAWASYGVAQRTSKTPEKFGTGSMEGVIAPSSANNAAVGGAWIPALVFGIPGDSVTAIVLPALLMYGIRPGPMIFEQSGDQVRSIFMIALITQFLLLICGFFGIKAFSHLLRLPRQMVLGGVVVFSVVGSYAIRNSFFDVWVMGVFGLIGFFLESKRVPLGPLILGLILGPMLEENLRIGLIKSSGDWTPFFTRPICIGLILVLLVAMIAPRFLKRFVGGPVHSAVGNAER
jgi:putative tricarboxylic transport membrane protein